MLKCYGLYKDSCFYYFQHSAAVNSLALAVSYVGVVVKSTYLMCRRPRARGHVSVRSSLHPAVSEHLAESFG